MMLFLPIELFVVSLLYAIWLRLLELTYRIILAAPCFIRILKAQPCLRHSLAQETALLCLITSS